MFDYLLYSKPSQPTYIDKPIAQSKDMLAQLFFAYHPDHRGGRIEASHCFRVRRDFSLDLRELIEKNDYTGRFDVFNLNKNIEGQVIVTSLFIEKRSDLPEWTDIKIKAILIPTA